MRRFRAGRRRLFPVAAALSALVVLAGCGGPADGSEAAPSSSSSSSAPVPTTSAPSPSTPRPVDKLLVIVFENHSAQQATEQMPHLASLADQYGAATQWYAETHPSLPNYLEIAGGSTFGVRDDKAPWAHPLPGQSVFGQLAAEGHDVGVFAESMPEPCATKSSGEYAVKHNAWAYFTSDAERRLCEHFDVPSGTPDSGALRDAVARGSLPTYGQLIPDLCHDGHDCPLSQADDWLQEWMDTIRSGPDFRSGRLAVVITFDEDDKHNDNHIATVVVAKQLDHVVVSRRMTHASLAAAPSRMAGLPALRGAKGSPDMLAAFGLE